MSGLLAPAAPGSVRRSLILAGGGMRVAYQAGVLLALEEAGISFCHADGTSGGTMNLAMLLSGLAPTAMCERWRSLDVKEFVSFLPIAKYLDEPGLMALGDAHGIINGVFPHLGIDPGRIRSVSDVQGTFNICNVTRKTLVVVPHQEIDLDTLVAGVSLPIFMPPVTRGGEQFMDAVWIKDANLVEAARRGADELWLVWCIGNSPTYHPGIFRQYVSMIELSANGGLFEEFDRLREWNGRLAGGETVWGRTRPLILHVIRPEHPLPLDPDYYLGRIDAATLIASGYADAHRYLANRSPQGLPFQPVVTAMTDPKPGITFRESMSGGFSLGQTDPAAGATAGQKTPLTMHASIAIDDIDAFVTDPAHAGSLTGTVDVPGLGTGIPAYAGVFNLFSPTDQPELKLMVYELAFVHDGVDHYLAGRKEVRNDPAYDLWKQTTTLYTTLHQGKDASGPVVGAGILHLGVIELTRLLASMHATNTTGFADSARVIGRFGSFFLGRLWDTYGPGKGKA